MDVSLWNYPRASPCLRRGAFGRTQRGALRSLRVLQWLGSSALPGRLVIDLDWSYGPRSGTPLRAEVWWWLLTEPHLQPPSVHVAVVGISSFFDFKSSWRHKSSDIVQDRSFSASSQAKLRSNVIMSTHMCSHPTSRTQERGGSAHTRVWSSNAVSWLTEIKVRLFPVTSSSTLPIP